MIFLDYLFWLQDGSNEGQMALRRTDAGVAVFFLSLACLFYDFGYIRYRGWGVVTAARNADSRYHAALSFFSVGVPEKAPFFLLLFLFDS